MITYILQVSFCWSVFLGLYYFLFRNETFFRLNRIYLLSTVLAGIFIPFLKYISIADLFESSSAVEYVYFVNQGFDQIEVTVSAVAGNSHMQIDEILYAVYAVGVFLLFIRFLIGYLKIRSIYQSGEVTSFENFKLIKSSVIQNPFSFFGKIFIPDNKNWSDQELQKVLSHEQCHCEEWHSMDVVFVEMLSIFCWFNPLAYVYKRELRNVHEFLADDYALKFSSVEHYGKLLLQNIANRPANFLENSFFNAQIKKRIKMMTKLKSSKPALLKYTTILPIFILLLFITACDVTGQVDGVKPADDSTVLKEVDEMPHFPGCEEEKADEQEKCWKKELLMFVYKNIKYPKEAKEKGIQGTNVLDFIVEKDGSISNINFLRSVGGGTDEECERVVKLMPRWVPGTHNGKTVRVKYTLPVKFKLEEKNDDGMLDASLNVLNVQSDGVYEKPDKMPYFVDCPEDKDKGENDKKCTSTKMLQFIYKDIKYPEAARKNRTEGVVILSFVIDKNGGVRDPEITRSIGDGCDEAVLNTFRNFQNAPDMKWVPGMTGGKSVDVRYVMPIKFKLESK